MQTELEHKARQALDIDSDWINSWPSLEPGWGLLGVSLTSQSTPADEAIYDTIVEDFTTKYPDDFTVVSGAWPGGIIKSLACRVLVDASQGIVDDNVTDAFEYAVDYAATHETVDYEDAISKYEYEQTLENITSSLPSMCVPVNELSEEDSAKAIFSWLWNQCIFPEGDDNCWFSEDELKLACYHLDFMDLEYNAPEWIEWMQDHPDEVKQKWERKLREAGQQELELGNS